MNREHRGNLFYKPVQERVRGKKVCPPYKRGRVRITDVLLRQVEREKRTN